MSSIKDIGDKIRKMISESPTFEMICEGHGEGINRCMGIQDNIDAFHKAVKLYNVLGPAPDYKYTFSIKLDIDSDLDILKYLKVLESLVQEKFKWKHIYISGNHESRTVGVKIDLMPDEALVNK